MSAFYATNGGAAANTVSDLYTIHETTAVATLLGSIGFKDVLTLAYDFDTGVLWGVANNNGVSNQLITLNTTTGAGTLVATMAGPVISTFSTAFIVGGVMYAWVESNLPEDRLAIIDRTTGNWGYVGVSGISSSNDGIGYNRTTGLAYLKGGNIANPLALTGVVSTGTSYSIVGGGSMTLVAAFTYTGAAVPYAIDVTGSAVNLVKIASTFTTNTNIVSKIPITGGATTLRALTWVPSAYVAPTVKSIPPTTGAAPQTPCAPKSELSNGGKGKFGCNNGGVGWTSSYAGPYGTVPQHEDPPDGEVMTGKEHAGVEVWLRWYHRDYPSGTVEMIQRALVELADPPAYEFGRKEEGLLSIGDIEHAIGNEQGGFEASTVDLQLSDAVDRKVRILLENQDLEGDDVVFLMASDLARGAA